MSVLPDEKRYNRVCFRQYKYVEHNRVCSWQWNDLVKQWDCPDTPYRAWLSPSIHEVVEEMENRLGRKIAEKDMSFEIFHDKGVDSGKIYIDWRGVLSGGVNDSMGPRYQA
jgi:hypothetical protein